MACVLWVQLIRQIKTDMLQSGMPGPLFPGSRRIAFVGTDAGARHRCRRRDQPEPGAWNYAAELTKSGPSIRRPGGNQRLKGLRLVRRICGCRVGRRGLCSPFCPTRTTTRGLRNRFALCTASFRVPLEPHGAELSTAAVGRGLRRTDRPPRWASRVRRTGFASTSSMHLNPPTISFPLPRLTPACRVSLGERKWVNSRERQRSVAAPGWPRPSSTHP